MNRKKVNPPDSYEVGYGSPPVHSRFRKGQSGNPSGKRRPHNAKGAKKLISQEAYRSLTVREGEKVRRIPALQAVFRSLIASAAKGNVQAQRAVIKIVQEFEAAARAGTSTSSDENLKELSDMSDEELMAIVRSAQNDKS
jgi:hypothetical protein